MHINNQCTLVSWLLMTSYSRIKLCVQHQSQGDSLLKTPNDRTYCWNVSKQRCCGMEKCRADQTMNRRLAAERLWNEHREESSDGPYILQLSNEHFSYQNTWHRERHTHAMLFTATEWLHPKQEFITRVGSTFPGTNNKNRKKTNSHLLIISPDSSLLWKKAFKPLNCLEDLKPKQWDTSHLSTLIKYL